MDSTVDNPVDGGENQQVEVPEEGANLGAEDLEQISAPVEGDLELAPEKGDDPLSESPPDEDALAESDPGALETTGRMENSQDEFNLSDLKSEGSEGADEKTVDVDVPTIEGIEVSEDEGRRKSSAVKIEIDHSSDECNVTCSKSDEVLSCAAAEDPQPKCADKPIPKPKYQIKEFVESASKLKFEIKNSGTTFNIYLPTLKKVVEVPEWEKVPLKREHPKIAAAMSLARERSRLFLYEMANRDVRMVMSEGRHLANQERARAIKERLLQQGRGIVKDLTEPPQRCDPSKQHGLSKRPTEYPPMPNLNIDRRPKDNWAGARLRCARVRYNQRSDDTWLRNEQLKLIKAAKRQQNCTQYNERLATPPQVHDPWAPPQKAHKWQPNISLPKRRS